MTNRLAREAGITPDEIAALVNYHDSDLFSALERDILSYVEAMTSTPARVSDALFQRLADQLSEPQLVELTAAIALENFSARFNRALGIEPEEP